MPVKRTVHKNFPTGYMTIFFFLCEVFILIKTLNWKSKKSFDERENKILSFCNTLLVFNQQKFNFFFHNRLNLITVTCKLMLIYCNRYVWFINYVIMCGKRFFLINLKSKMLFILFYIIFYVLPHKIN
jgi:tellurite resistance protein TehA-like permease